MSKKIFCQLFLAIFLIALLGGCTSSKIPALKGGYQSEMLDGGYYIQMSFHPDNNRFVQYINNREVDKGTYEEVNDGVYNLNSDKQQFEIKITSDNSFDVIVGKVNGGKPVEMINHSDTPVYFSTIFDDIDEYETLLE